jgi:hypothetical protein
MRWAAAHVSLDNPDGVIILLGGLREAGAEQTAGLTGPLPGAGLFGFLFEQEGQPGSVPIRPGG